MLTLDTSALYSSGLPRKRYLFSSSHFFFSFETRTIPERSTLVLYFITRDGTYFGGSGRLLACDSFDGEKL